MLPRDRVPVALLAAFLVILAWSGWSPRDRLTWWLEVLPALVGVGLLVATHRRFRFTTLAYVLAWLHAVILLVGGHYTYVEVPLGLWIRDALGLARNHYDRLGHVAQGFVPAILVRELLLRASPLGRAGRPMSRVWLFVTTLAFVVAISAVYELFEMGVARATGEAAEAFLALQGDPWDTQTDMLLALVSALAALLLLGRTHDRALRSVVDTSGRECGVQAGLDAQCRQVP